MSKSLSFGTDPEMFMVEPSSALDYADFIPNNLSVVPPAYMMMRGKLIPEINHTKHPVIRQHRLGNIIMDGAALEFNLKRPYSDPIEMFFDVQTMVEETRKLVKSLGKELYLQPTVNYDFRFYNNPEWMDSEQYYQGSIFGCDEDYNAWDDDYRCAVLDVATHPFRYAGGHLHISGSDSFVDALRATRVLSIFVGNFCVVNSPYPDLDKRRAKYYGMAGKFRPQNYPDGSIGVEYRSPSTSWISYPVEVFERMMNAAREAVHCLENWDKLGKELTEKYGEITIKAMADMDKETSLQILTELKL